MKESKWEVWRREPNYKVGTYDSQDKAESVRNGMGGVDVAYISRKFREEV